MILQIDSAAVQEIVKSVTDTGTQFLPSYYKLLAPAISAIVTAITAAIIRAVEKGKLNRKHEAIKKNLAQDNEILKNKINELKNR